MTSYLQNGAGMAEDYPGWNLLKSWTPSDGVHTAVIYMLLLLLGYPLIEPTEEMEYLGWNLLKKQGYLR